MAFNDLKSQYILAFAILKHDGPENKWNKISDDIREHVLASPVACLKQYNELSRLYQNDWQKSGDNEPFYKYLYFKLKKSYYSELCDKIQESRKVIDVVYEFVRHFGDGRIQVQDINDLIKQVDLKPENREISGKKMMILSRIKDYMILQNKICITDPLISNNHSIMSIPPFRRDSIKPIINIQTTELETREPNVLLEMFQDDVSQVPNIKGETISDENKEKILFDTNCNSNNNGCNIFSLLQDVCHPPAPVHHGNRSSERSKPFVVVDSVDSIREEKPVSNRNKEEIIELIVDDNDNREEEEEKQSTQKMDTYDEISNVTPIETEINETTTFQDVSRTASEDMEREEINQSQEDEENEESNLSLTTPMTQSSSESTQDNHLSQYDDISNETSNSIIYREKTAPSTTLESDNTSNKQLLGGKHSESSDGNLFQQSSINVIEDHSTIVDKNSNYTGDTAIDMNIFDTFSEDKNEYKEPECITIESDEEESINSQSNNNNNQSNHIENKFEQVILKEEQRSKTFEPKTRRKGLRITNEYIMINNNPSHITIKKTKQQFPTTPTKIDKQNRKPMLHVQKTLASSKYGGDFKKPILTYNLPEDYIEKIKRPMDLHQLKQNIEMGNYDENIFEFQRDVMIMFTNALYFYAPGDEVYVHALETLSLAQQLLRTTPNTLIPWAEQRLQQQKTDRLRSSTSKVQTMDYQDDYEFSSIFGDSKQELIDYSLAKQQSVDSDEKESTSTIAVRQSLRRTKWTNMAYVSDPGLRSKRKRTS